MELTIGERVKQIRESQKLSQGKFAKLLQISQSFLSDLEKNNTLPGVKLLLSLKEVLNININWLLINEGDMFSSKDTSSKQEDLNLIPEIKDLLEDLKNATNKAINLNKLIYSPPPAQSALSVREEKTSYVAPEEETLAQTTIAIRPERTVSVPYIVPMERPPIFSFKYDRDRWLQEQAQKGNLKLRYYEEKNPPWEEEPQAADDYETINYPMIEGQAACGAPSALAEEQIIDWIPMPAKFNIKADFVIQTKGESMIEYGIAPDMLCFIRKQSNIESGNIVLLAVNETDTIQPVIKKAKALSDKIVFQNGKGEIMELNENVSVVGTVTFWMPDIRGGGRWDSRSRCWTEWECSREDWQKNKKG
ncbi:MAG: LexA repressor [bacterium ADurb.Bin363]|nr:MAG: LexA repressor [bacterium ADurb.Bin363]